MTLLLDRQRGALVGLAVGDALGAAVEFELPGMFDEVTGYRDGGPHGLKPGEWTDDTSMALTLADSIANAGWDLDDQARRYLAWLHRAEYSVNGECFDIGGKTLGALLRFAKNGDSRIMELNDKLSHVKLAINRWVALKRPDGTILPCTTIIEVSELI